MLTTTRNAYIVEATARARRADEAWQGALVHRYGRAAGQARYDSRGYASPVLAALRERKLVADRRLDDAWTSAHV